MGTKVLVLGALALGLVAGLLLMVALVTTIEEDFLHWGWRQHCGACDWYGSLSNQASICPRCGEAGLTEVVAKRTLRGWVEKGR